MMASRVGLWVVGAARSELGVVVVFVVVEEAEVEAGFGGIGEG